MMQGVVNLRREATLTIVIGHSNRQLQAIDTAIALPMKIISMIKMKTKHLKQLEVKDHL